MLSTILDKIINTSIDKEGDILKEQGFYDFPFISGLKNIVEQNDIALQHVFKGKIRGCFLIDIKNQVMKVLGWNNLIKYYDFSWSNEKIITGTGAAVEYDICRMIVGIHRANSIFLVNTEIRRNEKSKRYKQQLISETIEKIKLRLYGSAHFRNRLLFQGEEFIYYPLPYELFAMSIKMNELVMNVGKCSQLYYGVVYNCISALSLLEDNLLGTSYPLCRGAIGMYFKLYWYHSRNLTIGMRSLEILRLSILVKGHIQKNLANYLKNVHVKAQRARQITFILDGLIL